MFAPEGYEMFARVEEAILQRIDAVKPLHATNERKNLLLEATEEYFWRCGSLSVASPQGLVMRISEEIALAVDEPQVTRTYQGYQFLDSRTWTVAAERFEERARAARALYEEMMRDPHAKAAWQATDRTPEQIQLVLDLTALRDVADEMHLATVFKNFDGWSLVVRSEDMVTPNTPFYCLEDVEQQNERCPGISPEHLADRIVAEFDKGNRLTRRYFRRGMPSGTTTKIWNEAWQMAAKQRPELSKPGPRGSRS